MQSKNARLGLIVLSIAAAVAVSGITLVDHAQGVDIPNDATFMTGHVEVLVTDGEGNIKAYRQGDNSIVNNGMNTMAVQTFSGITGTTSTGPVTHMQIGTSAVTPTGADTSITVIATCNRDTAAFSTAGASDSGGPPTVSAITITATATFSSADGAGCETTGIVEAGLFNSLTVGELFARNTFATVTLGAGDSLAITWTLTFTDT